MVGRMPSESPVNPPSHGRLRGWGKLIISVGVAFHCLAVAVPPLAFQTRGPIGSSPSVGMLVALVQRYCQVLYLDRGYAFFAPDPGPSHLIQAATTEHDGQVSERMYPDREQHWPRLLYHRHFMLAEYLTEIHQPPGPPAALVQESPEEAEDWKRRRTRYEHVRQSMVEHLKHKSGAKAVAIRRVEHLIPAFFEFNQEEILLTDPRFYQVLLDNPLPLDDADDLRELPTVHPETVHSPSAPPIGRDDDSEVTSSTTGLVRESTRLQPVDDSPQDSL